MPDLPTPNSPTLRPHIDHQVLFPLFPLLGFHFLLLLVTFDHGRGEGCAEEGSVGGLEGEEGGWRYLFVGLSRSNEVVIVERHIQVTNIPAERTSVD